MKNFYSDMTVIGAWGPIRVNSGNPANQFFFSQVGSSEKKIKADVIQKNNKLLVYPAEALMAGVIYQLESAGKSKPILKNIQIRETCLVYLIQDEDGSALWMNCPDEEPHRIIKPDDTIEDFTISPAGEMIIYTTKNDLGGNEIWQIEPDGSGSKLVYDCSESKCTNLDLDFFSSKLVFTQQNETFPIKLLDLQRGIVSNIDGPGSELSLSPDGKFLSSLDDKSGQLTITNLANQNIITAKSGSGLMGEWASDSRSILFGEMEYWGGIPGVKVNELEIPSGKIKLILHDPGQELEFYQPMYTRDEGIYLASVRLRSAGANKQFWLLREGPEGIKQITNDPLFHYSFPSWSPDYSELVFQRFPINMSDGQPQVVVWNRDSDTFRVIAENASRPFWLP